MIGMDQVCAGDERVREKKIGDGKFFLKGLRLGGEQVWAASLEQPRSPGCCGVAII